MHSKMESDDKCCSIFGAYVTVVCRDLVLVKNCAHCTEGSVCQGGQSVDIVDDTAGSQQFFREKNALKTELFWFS